MEKHTAEALLSAALSLDEGFGRIDEVISRISDDDLRKSYIDILGKLMEDVYRNLVRPILQEYPELDN